MLNNLENTEDLILVYPNPVDDYLTVEYAIFGSIVDGAIEIYNMEGKIVLSVSIDKTMGVKTINVSSIENGNYILSVGSKGEKGITNQISILH